MWMKLGNSGASLRWLKGQEKSLGPPQGICFLPVTSPEHEDHTLTSKLSLFFLNFAHMQAPIHKMTQLGVKKNPCEVRYTKLGLSTAGRSSTRQSLWQLQAPPPTTAPYCALPGPLSPGGIDCVSNMTAFCPDLLLLMSSLNQEPICAQFRTRNVNLWLGGSLPIFFYKCPCIPFTPVLFFPPLSRSY